MFCARFEKGGLPPPAPPNAQAPPNEEPPIVANDPPPVVPDNPGAGPGPNPLTPPPPGVRPADRNDNQSLRDHRHICEPISRAFFRVNLHATNGVAFQTLTSALLDEFIHGTIQSLSVDAPLVGWAGSTWESLTTRLCK